MTKKKLFLSLGGFAIIGLVFIGKLYFYHSLPVYDGTLSLNGIQDTVDVFTDPHGAPHIFAKNESDLFYTAGYIAARERLFQMTSAAAAVRGELALLYGDDLIRSDIYLRTWRIPEMASKLYSVMSPEDKQILISFCNGINACIEDLGTDLPVEFKILGVKPIKWRPEDVAGYERLMAHELESSWKPEIVYGAILEYFGKKKLLELLPDDTNYLPTIAETNQDDFYQQVFSAVWDEEMTIRTLLGNSSPDFGSNNWVLSGNKTYSGKPLLANDPHLEFTQPAKWYEMHLKGGRFNVSGVYLAGIPLPVIGQNENCAWGFTNVMTDDIDFFVETIHEKNSNLYLHGDSWKEMEIIHETIPLKAGRDTTIIVRKTIHGPVISDIHPLLKNSGNVLSMSWTGHKTSKDIESIIHLNLIQNWRDFSSAISKFCAPGQNMVYADTEGNIGWRPAVQIPIRKNGGMLVPRPGHDPEYDWKGWVPFGEMPYTYNPKSGVIATANNKTIGDEFPYYISNLWADPSRIQRINQRLSEIDKATVEDMKSIQLDLVSPFNQTMLPLVLSLETGEEEGNLKKVFSMLSDWDGNEKANSAEAMVFQAFTLQIVRNIFGDELALLGSSFLDAFIGVRYLNMRSLRKIFFEGTSTWIDDIRTKDIVETRDMILRQSLVDAINEIEGKLGYDPSVWAWGKLHTITHPHSMGKIKILDWLFGFNVGPFESGGSSRTVRAGGYSYRQPYKQTAGASMRRIVDFNNLNETQFILPTGQSGLHNSPYYDDQATMYNQGEYRTTWFDETFIRNSNLFQHLTITPK